MGETGTKGIAAAGGIDDGRFDSPLATAAVAFGNPPSTAFAEGDDHRINVGQMLPSAAVNRLMLELVDDQRRRRLNQRHRIGVPKVGDVLPRVSQKWNASLTYDMGGGDHLRRHVWRENGVIEIALGHEASQTLLEARIRFAPEKAGELILLAVREDETMGGIGHIGDVDAGRIHTDVAKVRGVAHRAVLSLRGSQRVIAPRGGERRRFFAEQFQRVGDIHRAAAEAALDTI